MAMAQSLETPAQVQIVKDQATGCCIAGGGPAGAMLALLLARRGVRVALLEMHHDFDREFRGDTVHPSTLEILDQLGLAERVHELCSNKISAPTLLTTRGPFTPFDFSRLKTKYRYILMVHQQGPARAADRGSEKIPRLPALDGRERHRPDSRGRCGSGRAISRKRRDS
jgi:choline dehydrogenase-like flavoprotein